MRAVLGLVPRFRAALAVLLGTAAVLTGAALLATSGALITGASRDPESLLVLLPMITSVRLFAISRASLRYGERLVSHDLTLRLVAGVRVRLLERLVPLAPAALSGARGGELLARLRTDVDELQGVFVRLVAPTAIAVLAGGVAVVLTAVVSVALAAVLAGLLLVLGVVVPAWAVRAGRPAAVARAEADAAYGTDLLDLVRGLGDHLAGDGGRTALAGLETHLARQQRAERSAARTVALTTLARDGVPALGVVAALWLVGWGVVTGAASPLLLAGAALGVLGAFEAVGGLGQAWSAAGGLRAAASRVEELAARPPAVAEPVTPRALPPARDLRFAGVTLTYPGSTAPALNNFDLDVVAGEHVALVGPSGAGKSSVLALALRAWDPGQGQVTIGGVDLRELALDDVRACTAWAPQAPQLLGGSIAGNLRLARPGAGDVELEAVLRQVGLAELVPRLQDWIGESGDRLSAGERARVGLARALLSPAPVLLVDEPTAHLDAAAAAHVLDVLGRDPRTVLLVTHHDVPLGSWRTVRLGAATAG